MYIYKFDQCNVSFFPTQKRSNNFSTLKNTDHSLNYKSHFMGLNSLTPILIFFHSPRNLIMVQKGAGLIGLTLLSYKFNVYKRVIKYINKSTLMFEEVAQRVVKPPMYHDVGHVCLRKWDRWTGQDNRAEKRETPSLIGQFFFLTADKLITRASLLLKTPSFFFLEPIEL